MAKMYENEGCAWSAPRKRRGRNLESLKICWNRGKDACDDDDHDHHGACDDDGMVVWLMLAQQEECHMKRPINI